MVHTGLQSKVALITGANHGIGAATARALTAEGAFVFINYLRLPPLGNASSEDDELAQSAPGLALYNARRAITAEQVIADIRAQGGRAEALEADLSIPETIPLLFDRAEAVFAPVDILVNNADYCVADTFILQSQFAGETTPAGYAPSPFSVASHDAHFASITGIVGAVPCAYPCGPIQNA